MYVLESLTDLAVAPLGQGWGLCGTRSDVYDAAKMSRLTLQNLPPKPTYFATCILSALIRNCFSENCFIGVYISHF